MSLVLLTATVLHVILASTVFQASAHPRCIHDTLQIAPHFDSATSLKRESNLGPPTRSDGLRIFIDWSPVNNPNVDVNRTCTQVTIVGYCKTFSYIVLSSSDLLESRKRKRWPLGIL